MIAAVFPFATNAVGMVPATIEAMFSLYLINALERAAGLRVFDLMTTAKEGEVLSLTRVLPQGEVMEAADRVGADISIWGSLHFLPEGRPVIEGFEVEMLVAAKGVDKVAGTSRLSFHALRGDIGKGTLEMDIAALEDLVEEMLVAMAGITGMARDGLHLHRIGEGLSLSDRALGYFACALRMAEDSESKQRLYLKAIAADPEFAAAYTNAAQLLLGQGRFGEAMRLMLRAEARLKGSDLEADVLNLLGVSTMHMGMWEDAVRVWQKALEIDAGHAEVLCNLASAYAMREMPGEAEECYRKALSLRDDYPLAWFALGRLLARQDEYEEAEACMRRYIELCPGDPWAYCILGSCLLRTGREEEAGFPLAKASQLDPDGEAGDIARRELQGLKQ